MSSDSPHPTPHDALFKRVFGDVRRGAALLRSILPPVLAERVDWDSVQLRSGSYVDAKLKGLASDLVFSAEIDGQPALFYLMVEHQSAPDPNMAWRLWRYVTRLWDRHGQVSGRALVLPLVIPVVVHHSRRPWSAPLGIDALIALTPPLRSAAADLVPRFRYVLDDLTRLDAAALRARGLPALATLTLWALRTASDRSFLGTVGQLADLFDEVRSAEDGAQALRTLFGYLSIISGRDEDLVHQVMGHLSQPVREDFMELEEMLAQKKLEQGREEGRAEGGAAMLLKLLRGKFTDLPDTVDARVRAASAEELDRWAERVHTADSLDDVLR